MSFRNNFTRNFYENMSVSNIFRNFGCPWQFWQLVMLSFINNMIFLVYANYTQTAIDPSVQLLSNNKKNCCKYYTPR